MNKKLMGTIAFAIGIMFCVVYRYYAQRGCTKDDSLVVSMMSGWAPFMTINGQGEYEGFDVDVAQVIAQKMNKKLVIRDLGSLAPTFIALQQGKINMIMSGLDITQARLKTMEMIPYAGVDVRSFSLLFWKEVPKEIACIKDLAKTNAVVCVEPGSGQEKFLDSVKGITQKSLNNVQEMVLDLKYGKSDAILVEPLIARRIMRLNPEIKELIVPLPTEFMTFGFGIAINKDNRELVNQVTSIINDLKRDGMLQRLKAKYQLETV